jgi:hypothetical protein
MLFPVGTDEFREPIWRSIEHRQEQDKTKKMRKKIWVCVLTFFGVRVCCLLRLPMNRTPPKFRDSRWQTHQKGDPISFFLWYFSTGQFLFQIVILNRF